MKIKRKKIIPQMLDVIPVNQYGDLDLEKIQGIGVFCGRMTAKQKLKTDVQEKIQIQFSDIRKPDTLSDEISRLQRLPEDNTAKRMELEKQRRKNLVAQIAVDYDFNPAVKITPRKLNQSKEYAFNNELDENQVFPGKANKYSEDNYDLTEKYFDGLEQFEPITNHRDWDINPIEKIERIKGYFFGDGEFVWNFGRKFALSFTVMAGIAFVMMFGTNFLKKSLQIKDSAMIDGKSAYNNLAQAKEEILNKNFDGSRAEFFKAYEKFNKISTDLNSIGGFLVDTTRYIPYLSKLSSGAALASAGRDISMTGVLAGDILKTLNDLKNPLEKGENDGATESISLLKIFQDTHKNVVEIQALLTNAQINIEKVNFEDIPAEQRVQFSEVKSKIPDINGFLAEFMDNSQIFTDVLGGNGPRKYLFLFQNNQEMRATGGFIGTYGVLDIFNGHIRSFFIDGIFNPDGQLREKVVPPAPLQKISAAWSLHDSNWFPDFPVSAEKAAWFYEKTGGPTVDGVITMTPVVMQELLEITGPIEMPEYEITIDADNFIEKVQKEVEVDYDKELNQPKKILADLAPKILDKIFNARNSSDIFKTIKILNDNLNEKHILIYSKNYEIQKKLSTLGWSGEVLEAQKDYLSVINTNINGYKTDGVVDEKIEHLVEIQNDGSIINTVTITRQHNGGNKQYEWWNKVNANYMRVYVPNGSQLLSAEGQTREYNSPPLDYAALSFKHDAQVRMEEDSIKIDEISGTRVYQDAGKTVFANWVYVSPQETVQVKYRYLLPFKIALDEENKIVDTYSLLAQKQSGSAGSQFVSQISLPSDYKINWKYPDEIETNEGGLKFQTDLKGDKFVGVAITK